MAKAIIIDLELHWGYSIKEPLYTASQPTYKLPPQTTVVGALAYPYAYVNRLPENVVDGDKLYSTTRCLASMIKWVSVRNTMAPLGPIETMDINRLILVLGIRRAHLYPGSKFIWGVQPVGKVYSPFQKLEVLVIPSENRVDEVAKLAYSIVRLGCKEGITAVNNVKIIDINVSKQNMVSTSYYFPKRLAKNMVGNYIITYMPTLSKNFYRLAYITDPHKFMEEFIIPREKIDVVPSDEAIVLYIPYNREYLIVPKEVLET
ncbi:MAG: type I-A CRISPR-associated protein Cas5 [Thermoprotei archaeon]|nr:MAG: type I-A CRISPR-associated protein Cas5 [Thermoprotei archaeon]